MKAASSRGTLRLFVTVSYKEKIMSGLLERHKRLFEIGGFIAGAVLIAFGAVSIWMGTSGLGTVTNNLKQEKITAGDDMSPAAIKAAWAETGITVPVTLPSCSLTPDQPINSGSEARCFAQYMRIHALESSNGLTYSEMGRFVSAANPDDPAGTSDPAAALTDDQGNPVSNAARNTWVTETALSTALNVSYFAENVAKFGIVVGIALLLSGFGFVVLAVVALAPRKAEEPAPAAAPTRAAPAS
jgi:hypothetical protein